MVLKADRSLLNRIVDEGEPVILPFRADVRDGVQNAVFFPYLFNARDGVGVGLTFAESERDALLSDQENAISVLRVRASPQSLQVSGDRSFLRALAGEGQEEKRR